MSKNCENVAFFYFTTIFWQKVSNEARNTIFSKNGISEMWLKLEVSILFFFHLESVCYGFLSQFHLK